MIRTIYLFDLDGTLTDPQEGITKSIRYALDAFGIQEEDASKLMRFIGPPIRDAFREYYDFTEEEAEQAVAKFREYFSVKGIFENVPYDGVVQALKRLKEEGLTLAIATSKATVYAKQIAEHFEFAQYFDFIAGCEMDGTRSRKSEVIQYALDAVDPKRQRPVVMIGDREHDVIGAKEMGIDGVGVTWGYGSRKELQEAGAKWIVDTAEELVDLLLREGVSDIGE